MSDNEAGCVPLVIGVIGHRTIFPDDRQPLRIALEAVIREYQSAYPGTPLIAGRWCHAPWKYNRACLAGTLQGVSGSAGRSLPDCAPLRGTKPAAGQYGQAESGLGVVQFEAHSSQRS